MNGFAVGVDWLDFTYKNINSVAIARERLADIEAITSDPIGFKPHEATFNGHAWDGKGTGIYGTQVWYLASRVDEVGNFHSGQLKIAMSGSVLRRCDMEVLALYLLRMSIPLDITCQRIDIALDDFDSFIDLDDVRRAHEAGNFFNASWSGETNGGKRGQPRGKTIYFGSPKSDKRARWYDKFAESGGKQTGNRAEGQFRRKSADSVFYDWLDGHDHGADYVARLLQNFVLGLIDFRERDEDDKSRARCSLLGWYKSLLDLLRANPARVVVKVVEQTVQKSIDWLSRSVAQTIAVIKIALGHDFDGYIAQLIIGGGEALNNKKRYIATTTDKELLYWDGNPDTTTYAEWDTRRVFPLRPLA